MDAHMDAKVLRRAAELVEQGHCKEHPALNAERRQVMPGAADATAWCLTGSLERAVYEVTGVALERTAVAWWNEQRGVLLACAAACAERGLRFGGEAVAWNNAPERTADESRRALSGCRRPLRQPGALQRAHGRPGAPMSPEHAGGGLTGDEAADLIERRLVRTAGCFGKAREALTDYERGIIYALREAQALFRDVAGGGLRPAAGPRKEAIRRELHGRIGRRVK